MGVFAAEVVRGGSGKLIDGNRMFYGVARERERQFVWGGSHTHAHTHYMLHENHIPYTHMHVQ